MEEKAKMVAAVWGTELLIQFFATFLHQHDLKKGINSSYCSNRPGEKQLARQRIGLILPPKQQRLPLPSLLSSTFFYVGGAGCREEQFDCTAMQNVYVYMYEYMCVVKREVGGSMYTFSVFLFIKCRIQIKSNSENNVHVRKNVNPNTHLFPCRYISFFSLSPPPPPPYLPHFQRGRHFGSLNISKNSPLGRNLVFYGERILGKHPTTCDM